MIMQHDLDDATRSFFALIPISHAFYIARVSGHVLQAWSTKCSFVNGSPNRVTQIIKPNKYAIYAQI